jgi:hypothetical protein
LVYSSRRLKCPTGGHLGLSAISVFSDVRLAPPSLPLAGFTEGRFSPSPIPSPGSG